MPTTAQCTECAAGDYPSRPFCALRLCRNEQMNEFNVHHISQGKYSTPWRSTVVWYPLKTWQVEVANEVLYRK